jgi:hypothetical protein
MWEESVVLRRKVCLGFLFYSNTVVEVSSVYVFPSFRPDPSRLDPIRSGPVRPIRVSCLLCFAVSLFRHFALRTVGGRAAG